VNQEFTVTTAKLPADVLAKLREWASFNLTSVNAEIVKSVRLRAALERDQTGRRAGKSHPHMLAEISERAAR
jgi:hypothetical protein